MPMMSVEKLKKDSVDHTRVNDSAISSQYQRHLDQNEYQESPHVKNSFNQNSYLNSDQSIQVFENAVEQLDIDEFEIQNQVYLEQIGNEFRQKLPLDVI